MLAIGWDVLHVRMNERFFTVSMNGEDIRNPPSCSINAQAI